MKWFRKHIVDHLPAHLFWTPVLAIVCFYVAGATPDTLVERALEKVPDFIVRPHSLESAVLLFRVVVAGIGVALSIFVLAWVLRTRFTRSVPASPMPMDMTSREVVNYIASESQWGAAYEDDAFAFVKACFEFDRAARDGQISVRARPQFVDRYETLDRTFWRTSGLDVTRHLEDGVELRTEPKEILVDSRIYIDPLVDRATVEKVWRRKQRR